jgi:hypothetical protein
MGPSAGPEAELNRHKGELRQGHPEAAQELYRKALSIARAQEAKLWELRAAVSLARLHRDQGRRAEARDLLAPVYGRYRRSEGGEGAAGRAGVTARLSSIIARLHALGRAPPVIRWQ